MARRRYNAIHLFFFIFRTDDVRPLIFAHHLFLLPLYDRMNGIQRHTGRRTSHFKTVKKKTIIDDETLNITSSSFSLNFSLYHLLWYGHGSLSPIFFSEYCSSLYNGIQRIPWSYHTVRRFKINNHNHNQNIRHKIPSTEQYSILIVIWKQQRLLYK